MVSTTDPTRMTADQRLDEIAGILASDTGNRVSPYVTVRNAREGGTEP